MNAPARFALSRRRSQRGLAAVEFAIILPVVLFLMLATAELGRALYQYNTLTKAVRNGARYLSKEANGGVLFLDSTTIAATQNITVYGNEAGTGDPVIASLTPDDITVTSSDPTNLDVQADFAYQPLFATLPGLVGGQDIDMAITLSVSNAMRAI